MTGGLFCIVTVIVVVPALIEHSDIQCLQSEGRTIYQGHIRHIINCLRNSVHKLLENIPEDFILSHVQKTILNLLPVARATSWAIAVNDVPETKVKRLSLTNTEPFSSILKYSDSKEV